MTRAIIVKREGAYIVAAEGAAVVGSLTAQAKAARDAAAASAALAESASGPTYANTTAGLAATTDGQGFAVDNGDGTVTVYLNDSGSAVAQRTLATTAFLASTSGAAQVGFLQSGSGAVARTLQDKAREIVSFADQGAPTDGSDATADIDNALATSRSVDAASGNYRAQDITLDQDGQILSARGTVNILRNANGALIDSSASDITISGVAFYGDDPTYTGDLLKFSGQRGTIFFCSARDAGTDDALTITGSAWMIFGTKDVYEGNITITTDGVGGVSQYHNIIGLRQAGDLSLIDTSFVSISHSLINGDVLVDKGIGTPGGHGSRITTTRIVGDLTIKQASTSIGSGVSVSGNVTIGDGTNGYDGIVVDPSFVQALGDPEAPHSFTIMSGVKGVFHLGNIVAVGVTVTIPTSVRKVSNIYHGEIDYTPTISGDSGSFAVGNGSVTGKFSQQGNHIVGRTILSIGSTTTLPSSGLFTTVPVNTDGRPILCQIDIFVSGVGNYSAIGKIASDGSRVIGWLPYASAIDDLFTATFPATLGADDVVTWAFSYALGGV